MHTRTVDMHQLSPPPRLDKMCICQMCSSHYSSHNSRSLQLILLPPLQLSERMLSRQKMWLSPVIYWHMTPVVTATVVNYSFTLLGKYRLCSIKMAGKKLLWWIYVEKWMGLSLCGVTHTYAGNCAIMKFESVCHFMPCTFCWCQSDGITGSKVMLICNKALWMRLLLLL